MNCYTRDEPVDKYSETHAFKTEAYQDSMVNEIFKMLNKMEKISERYIIIDLGSAPGELLTVQLLNRADQESLPLEVIGFDISDKNIKSLKKNIEKLGFELTCEADSFVYKGKNGTCSYKLEKVNLENIESFKEKIKNIAYHMCFSFFLLHHILNWRELVICTLQNLCKNGVFITCTVNKHACVMDGRFNKYQNINESDYFSLFWKEYYFQRNTISCFHTELAASDLDLLILSLNPILQTTSYVFKNAFHINDFSFEKCLDFITEGVFAPLSNGLSEKDRKKLREKMEKWLEDHLILDLSVEHLSDLQFYTFQRYCEEDSIFKDKLINQISSSYNLQTNDPLFVENYSNFMRLNNQFFNKESFFTHHQMLLLNSLFQSTTIFSALISWTLVPKQTYNAPYPFSIHLQFMDQADFFDILTKFSLFMKLSDLIGYQISTFIFNDLLLKPECVKIVKGCTNSTENYIKMEKHPVFHIIREITIIIPDGIVNEISKILNSVFTGDTLKDYEKEIEKFYNEGNFSENDIYNFLSKFEKYPIEKIETIYKKVEAIFSSGLPTTILLDFEKKLKEYGLVTYDFNVDKIKQVLLVVFITAVIPKWEKYYYLITKFSYSESNTKEDGFGGIMFAEKQCDAELNPLFDNRIIKLYKTINLIYSVYGIQELIKKNKENSLRTAIISILVDSYAHNISAHSLVALNWWFELRSRIWNKPIKTDDKITIKFLEITKEKLKLLAAMTSRYYKVLGTDDNANNSSVTSLSEIVRFLNTTDWRPNDGEQMSFTVPLDEYLANFFRFLRNKAALWSGVTRDRTYGGMSKNLYSVLWDFVNNPLFIGTISHSEKISKLHINIELPKYLFSEVLPKEFLDKISAKKFSKDGNIDYVKMEFALIDLSLLDHEEKLCLGIDSASNSCEQNSIEIDYYYLFDESDKFNQIQENFKKIQILDVNKNKIKVDSLQDLNKKVYEVNFGSSISEDIPLNNLKIMKERYSTTLFYLPVGIKYSKYSIVIPAKHHYLIRKELQKQIYDTFFPGGIIGEQALFTLIENTIRNVKHYNPQDYKDGLCLNLRLTPQKLKSNKELSNDNRIGHEIFKIGIFLDHKSTNKKEDNVSLLEKLQETCSCSIINENNKPRLGGSSQDKICSAMLLNNSFSSVDLELKNEQTDRDKHYNNEKDKIYWIGFDDLGEKMDDNRIMKYLQLWKSDFIYNYKDTIDKDENISRFRFVATDKKLSLNDIIDLRDKGVIRIVSHSEDKEKKKVYNEWLNDFLEKKKVVINFKKCKKIDNFDSLSEEQKKEEIEKIQIQLQIDDFELKKSDFNEKKPSKDIFFHHSGDVGNIPSIKIANYRSHGWMRENIFSGDNFTYHKINGVEINNHIVSSEFIEAIMTNICIIDNRINSKFIRDLKPKFENILNLSVFDEVEKDDKQQGEKIVSLLGKSKDDIKNGYQFFVIHLSYLETLGYKDKLPEFFVKELGIEAINDINDIPKNFFVVITTGRGNDAWYDNLGNYKAIVIFKPIEAILDAVEQGINLADDIQVKYNLAKVLFGS